MTDNVLLANLIDTNNPDRVFDEVKKIFSYHYDETELNVVNDTYTKIKKTFNGEFSGYRACNTNYHNFAHTMDALLATIRLVDGYNLKEGKFPSNIVISLLLAVLFHDIGYIQENDDNKGTGAKYTATHVERSIAFITKNIDSFYIGDVNSITRLIRCTGLRVDINAIPFADKNEKMAGLILATADLIGQMADRVYLEKLLFLYYEFKEADLHGYETEFDIIRKTLDFYEVTKDRLSRVYGKMYIYARFHFLKRYDVNENLYIEAMNKNIGYIKTIIDDNKTNFRSKLKRGNLIKKAS